MLFKDQFLAIKWNDY